MQQKWFRARKYGWGWTPITWQGWIVTATYLLLLVDTFLSIDSHSHSVSDTLINFIPNFILLSVVLFAVCSLTGEKSHWSWGNKKKETNETKGTQETKGKKKKSAKKKSPATRK